MSFDKNGDWHDDEYTKMKIATEETTLYKLFWSGAIIVRLLFAVVVIGAICGGIYACGRFLVE
jgi:hypothetical protein